ncbi:hypothetical protein U1Q18_015871 [Sarracenia purpurea var. burkii]
MSRPPPPKRCRLLRCASQTRRSPRTAKTQSLQPQTLTCQSKIFRICRYPRHRPRWLPRRLAPPTTAERTRKMRGSGLRSRRRPAATRLADDEIVQVRPTVSSSTLRPSSSTLAVFHCCLRLDSLSLRRRPWLSPSRPWLSPSRSRRQISSSLHRSALLLRATAPSLHCAVQHHRQIPLCDATAPHVTTVCCQSPWTYTTVRRPPPLTTAVRPRLHRNLLCNSS